MIKAFLFDLDGVLVDACDWHYNALNLALDEVCNFTISKSEHIKTFNGRPTLEKLKILVELGRISDQQIEKISYLKQQYTIEIIKTTARPLDKKIEMLKYLKSKKIQTVCVTNSIYLTAVLMLEKTGQYPYIDLLIDNEIIKTKGLQNKPSPDPYLYALEKIKIEPNEAVIIEDSPIGILSAKASKCHVEMVSSAEEVDIHLCKKIMSEYK